MHDTEDRAWWYEYGESLEATFVKGLRMIGYNAEIHPDKEFDPTGPDLLVNGVMADLKVQETPFFKSETICGIPPQHAVTFNRSDAHRYGELYDQIVIYYWVKWNEMERYGIGVPSFNAVFEVPFRKLLQMIGGGAHYHAYQKRINDPKNSQGSYILDTRQFKKIWSSIELPTNTSS